MPLQSLTRAILPLLLLTLTIQLSA